MRKFLWASLALAGVVAGAGALWEPLAATEYETAKRTYDAEIVRDEYGVPHINGATDADTAYGLAYAQPTRRNGRGSLRRHLLSSQNRLRRARRQDHKPCPHRSRH